MSKRTREQASTATPPAGERTSSARKKKTTTRSKKKAPVQESPADPHRLATVFLHQRALAAMRTLRFWRSQFWEWLGTHYRALERADLHGQVTQAVKHEFDRVAEAIQAAKAKDEDDETTHVLLVKRSTVSDVVQALQGKLLVPASVDQPAWWPPKPDRHIRYLALSNGLVDSDALLAGETVTPLPHTPDWFSPTCLPYVYNLDGDCQRWTHFVDEVMEGDADRIALIQEWFGYCLTPDTSQQKFLLICGEGRTGKTVTLDVLTALLGADNVAHVPVELFDRRFQLTPTVGKLANIATEVGEISRGAEAVLKAFTSGDRMYFDRKGITGVQAIPTARLAFAANNLPRFADRSSGLWRRMLLVPYRVVIPEAQQDRHLLDTLLQELPGIFNWAVAGLRRLRARGHFTEPSVCRDALDAYRTESNPAQAFLDEWTYAHPTSRTGCAVLYERYRSWSKEHGYPPLDAGQFGKEVARCYPGVQRRRGPTAREQRRPYEYVGLALRDSASAPAVRPAAPRRAPRPRRPVPPSPVKTPRVS